MAASGKFGQQKEAGHPKPSTQYCNRPRIVNRISSGCLKTNPVAFHLKVHGEGQVVGQTNKRGFGGSEDVLGIPLAPFLISKLRQGA